MLQKLFFSAKLNELDLIKLKILSESEMRGIIAGDRSIYDKKNPRKIMLQDLFKI